MTSLRPEAEYLMEHFKWGLPESRFDITSISVTGDKQIFTLVIFADF